MGRVYKVGIIGLGRIASLMEKDSYARRYYKYLTHAATFTSHPGFKIVAACDIDLKRLYAFGKRWNVKRLYKNYADMLKNEDIDLLIISTPADSHAGIIKYSTGRVRLILCEKPLAKGSKDIKQIVELCKMKNTQLAVNLIRHYDTSHSMIRRYIHSRRFGAIKRVICTYGKGIYNTGPHLIDMLLYFFGDADYVRALFQIRQGYGETTPDVFIMFNKKTPCFIQAVDYDDYRIFEIDIFGTRERIRIEDEGLNISQFKRHPNRFEKGAFELKKVRSLIMPTMDRAFYSVADNMFDVLDKGARPLFSGYDYLKIENVIEAIKKSGLKNGKPIKVG